MSNEHEIESRKILVKDIFKTLWFRIPEYQRPYIWSKDEINELLDDLTFALTNKPEREYFLGSFVYQSKKPNPAEGRNYVENDLLDGQQRMTTLLLLFACIRDITSDQEAKSACQKCIHQEGNNFEKVPQRNRLVFAIRDDVNQFVDTFVRAEDGTTETQKLKDASSQTEEITLQNMAIAIIEIRKFLRSPRFSSNPEDLLSFLLNKVLLIYVATQDLEDAFRLFTILNDRGVPLRNSDILKSLNLGALDTDRDRARYAKLWEVAEGNLGEDFDRFLNHIRTILLKEKARLNVLQEFEEKIYEPKLKGVRSTPLLNKGKDTFLFVEKYLKHYDTLLYKDNSEEVGNTKFDNMIRIMLVGLPSTDWVPPLLRYYEKFRYANILGFLTKLDNKLSSDWISQFTPTYRIDKMNTIIKVIEGADSVGDVLSNTCFDVDNKGSFIQILAGDVYRKRFARYLLLKLDYLLSSADQKLSLNTLSIEHILPQNPKPDSQWCRDFNSSERELWTDRLGNLVLITRRKNSSQGRLDYSEKLRKYFTNNIDTCPNSLSVLRNSQWGVTELKANHKKVLSMLFKHYELPTDG